MYMYIHVHVHVTGSSKTMYKSHFNMYFGIFLYNTNETWLNLVRNIRRIKYKSDVAFSIILPFS
jgi:hypothetical protein